MNNDEDKEIFVVYVGKETPQKEILDKLANRIHDNNKYCIKAMPFSNLNLLFAKITPKDIANYVVTDKDNYTFLISSCSSDDVDSELEKEHFILESYKKYSYDVFQKMKGTEDFSTVIFDPEKSVLLAGTTNSQGKNSQLYYGYTRDAKELMISNDSATISEFCNNIHKITDGEYMKNGKMYASFKKNLDNISSSDSKSNPLSEDMCLKLIEDDLYSQLSRDEIVPFYKAIKRYIILKNNSDAALAKISFEDEEKIASVAMTSLSVLDLYAKLYAIEADGNKDSDEYKKILDYLKVALEVEKSEYENIDIGFSKFLCYVSNGDFVRDSLDRKLLQLGKDDMVDYNSDQLATRFLNYLINNDSKLFSTTYEIIPSGLIEIMKKAHISSPSLKIENAIRTEFEEGRIFGQDVSRAFQVFLNKEIETNKDPAIKDCLIYHKYKESFINPCIENELVENDFDLPECINIDTTLNAAFLGVSTEKYKKNISTLAINAALDNINELLGTKDIDYSDADTAALSIIKQCYLRANLVFMTDEDINDLKDEFIDSIQSDEYLKDYKDDHISINLITEAFNARKKDRELIKDGEIISKKVKSIN